MITKHIVMDEQGLLDVRQLIAKFFKEFANHGTPNEQGLIKLGSSIYKNDYVIEFGMSIITKNFRVFALNFTMPPTVDVKLTQDYENVVSTEALTSDEDEYHKFATASENVANLPSVWQNVSVNFTDYELLTSLCITWQGTDPAGKDTLTELVISSLPYVAGVEIAIESYVEPVNGKGVDESLVIQDFGMV